MTRASLNTLNHGLVKSANFHGNFVSKLPFSSASSSSLQTIENSQSKPLINPLYNLLPETQNPNKIVDLISSSLKQNSSQLTLLKNDIKPLIPHLGSHEITRVLLRFQSDSFSASTFFNWVKNDLGIKPSSHNYCYIVHILTWSKNFPLAMELLCELIDFVKDCSNCEDVFESLVLCSKDCNFDPVVFDMLIKGYVRKGMVKEGIKTFRNVLEVGHLPSVITCNCLLNGLLRLNFIDQCWLVRGVVPDLVSYTALMSGLCKERRVREAHQLFHRMVHRGLDPDIVSYNTLISGYCKEGRMQESKYLMHEMIGNGISPDSFTCRVLVEGYAKQGRLVSALNLVVELRRFRVSVSSDIYDFLMVSLCHEDRPFAAKSLLERISQDGYLPKPDIYNELIQSFCRCNSVTDALLLKAEMLCKRIKVDLVAYKALICSSCRIGKAREAESLMEEMLKSDILPDPQICRELIQCYCKQSDMGKAESILSYFAKEFQIFDTKSYNILVRTYTESGDMDKLMGLQDRMMKLGFAPNSLTCKYVINGLLKAKRLNNHKLLGSQMQ
ncbi:hypothetical protein like AT5G40400 [Hibiscus trionum]|uniref:Pentatricopeptide repeat-containing protein n=1 Tax=Hibiscus trionum TaxID=183268 RepID=A0A9W7IL91_HIBTR|nr:hypothetical protein like AT5G40400 [Hibiscus trionum]